MPLIYLTWCKCSFVFARWLLQHTAHLWIVSRWGYVAHTRSLSSNLLCWESMCECFILWAFQESSVLFTLQSTLIMSYLTARQHPQWFSQVPLEIQEVVLRRLHEWPDCCQHAPVAHIMAGLQPRKHLFFWGWKALNITAGCPLADTGHHFSFPVCGVRCQRWGITPLSLRCTSALG